MNLLRRLRASLSQDQSLIVSATAITIMLNGSSLLISGVTSILMARVLGVEQLAYVVLFNMGISTISIFADFAGVYYANIYLIACRQHSFSLSTISGTLISYGIISGLLTGLLFCFQPIRLALFPQFTELIWGILLMAAICGYSTLRQISALYTGQRDFFRAGLVTLLPVAGYATVATIGVQVLGWKTGLWAAIAQVVSVLLCVAFFLILLWRRGISRPSLVYLSHCFKLGKRAAISSWLGFLHTRADQYLVNWICGPVALVFYGIAVSLCELLTRIPGMMGQVIFPIVAAENEARSAVRKTLRYSVGVMIFVGLISVPMLAFSDRIITMLYGENFASSVPAFRILLPAAVFMSGVRIIDNHLSGIGYPMIKVIALIISIAVNIAANLMLLPHIGIMGAALASSISYLVWLYIIFAHLWRLSPVNSTDPALSSQIITPPESSRATA